MFKSRETAMNHAFKPIIDVLRETNQRDIAPHGRCEFCNTPLVKSDEPFCSPHCKKQFKAWWDDPALPERWRDD